MLRPLEVLSFLLFRSMRQWLPCKTIHTTVLITFLEFSLSFIWVTSCVLDVWNYFWWLPTHHQNPKAASPLKYRPIGGTVLSPPWVLPQMARVSRVAFILISGYLVKSSLNYGTEHRRPDGVWKVGDFSHLSISDSVCKWFPSYGWWMKSFLVE